MNRLEVTESLYTQVTQMWYNFLRDLLKSRVVFNELDAILGKKDNDTDDQTDSNKLGKTKTRRSNSSVETIGKFF